MHRHPSGVPTPESSMTPSLPSLIKHRVRDTDAMSVASSMTRSMSSTQVNSWKDDEHIQEWYLRRKEKEKELAKMKIRRAHKDLNWVLERRTAQIANFRRDRKNEEKQVKTAEVKDKAHSATSRMKGLVNAAAKLKARARPFIHPLTQLTRSTHSTRATHSLEFRLADTRTRVVLSKCGVLRNSKKQTASN